MTNLSIVSLSFLYIRFVSRLRFFGIRDRSLFRCAELLQLLGTRRSFLPRLRHQDFMSNLTLKRKNSGI